DSVSPVHRDCAPRLSWRLGGWAPGQDPAFASRATRPRRRLADLPCARRPPPYTDAMPLSQLSASTQDYLKCIWTLQEWSEGPVSVTALAERLGVRTSSASDGVKKLAEHGLVDHVTYGGITLTETGRKHALAMVRRHRLLETF